MSIIILTLFSYIFNPSVTESEQNKLVQKFNISFALKRTPKTDFSEKKLIKLYNDGKYKEYIKSFNKYKKKFIYVKNSKINFNKLYLYQTLSLKILSKNRDYQNSLCLIKASLNNFENLPPFVLKEFKDNCSNLKNISINNNKKNIKIYINGLLINDSIAYVNENIYNLTICNNKTCKYLKTKSSNINKQKYSDYFSWKIKKGLFISNTIPDSFFQYYNVKQVHYFYKKNNELYHKVKLNNGVIILEEKVSLENDSNSQKNKIILNSNNKPTEQSSPFYKKWYFYVGIVAIVGITAGGVYWLQQDSGTNTSITWQ